MQLFDTLKSNKFSVCVNSFHYLAFSGIFAYAANLNWTNGNYELCFE